jgi:hypothetical protein
LLRSNWLLLIVYLTDEEENVIVCFIDRENDLAFQYHGTPHLVYVYEVGPFLQVTQAIAKLQCGTNMYRICVAEGDRGGNLCCRE